MERKWLVVLSSMLALSASPMLLAGDDAKPNDGKPADGGDKDGGRRRGPPDRNRDGGPGGPGRDAGGRGGPGGNWGGMAGGLGGLFGAGGRGTGGATSMISRMLGIEIEDPKAAPRVDSLPLGAEKRMVLNVPIGGVDNPGAGNGAGWKMETVFKMTEEQTKAVETLRDEYKEEEKKLNKEILDQQKALAEKVKQLRQKYEQRANDILTGDDKATKEKMDALAKETATKNTTAVNELIPLYDLNDIQQGFALVRAAREKTNANIKDAETKLVELIPADNRPKFQEIIKQQSETREQMNRWMGGPGGGGPGGRGRGNNEPVAPPRPPDAAPGQGNF